MTTNATPTETDEVDAPRRRRIRSGATALIASIILILWVVLGAWLGILAIGNEVAGVIATIIFFASWLVIPLLIVAILVFAIIALLVNPVVGKIMGAVAIVLPFVVAALFWNSLGGFSDSFLF